jgi:hypothetical protein
MSIWIIEYYNEIVDYYRHTISNQNSLLLYFQ